MRDDAWLERAKARLAEWRARGLIGVGYLDEWAKLLDGPVEVLAARLVDDSESARALRQTTPFAGVLSPRERMDIHRRVRRQVESAGER